MEHNETKTRTLDRTQHAQAKAINNSKTKQQKTNQNKQQYTQHCCKTYTPKQNITTHKTTLNGTLHKKGNNQHERQFITVRSLGKNGETKQTNKHNKRRTNEHIHNTNN